MRYKLSFSVCTFQRRKAPYSRGASAGPGPGRAGAPDDDAPETEAQLSRPGSAERERPGHSGRGPRRRKASHCGYHRQGSGYFARDAKNVSEK